ncbi:hypothetical protein H0H81_003456 [Sphagnurus paluster]|uniref:Uncharacterized protein n=1 Tax=Sphagnurus paluster TaxID=117069 RepID=A0A9P7GLG1_9AGAR|nr:hypothetical protein H0H81_003456 [Sphagnurus paluster]
MRIASLLISALAALTAIAAPLRSNDVTSLESDPEAIIISHQVQPLPSSKQARKVYLGIRTPAFVPSVEELKEQFIVAPDSVLFYSGPGGYIGKARTRAGQMGLQILEDSWKDKAFPDAYQALAVEDVKQFWDNASQALAELATGTVYVLVPESTIGTEFFAKSIWARVEWPALQVNTKAVKVVKIFPENDKEEVIKGARLA